MSIRFSCPQCNKHFKVKDQFAGKAGRCPCGSHIRIPSDCLHSKTQSLKDLPKESKITSNRSPFLHISSSDAKSVENKFVPHNKRKPKYSVFVLVIIVFCMGCILGVSIFVKKFKTDDSITINEMAKQQSRPNIQYPPESRIDEETILAQLTSGKLCPKEDICSQACMFIADQMETNEGAPGNAYVLPIDNTSLTLENLISVFGNGDSPPYDVMMAVPDSFIGFLSPAKPHKVLYYSSIAFAANKEGKIATILWITKQPSPGEMESILTPESVAPNPDGGTTITCRVQLSLEPKWIIPKRN